MPRAYAPQQEKPSQWEAHTLESSPCSRKLEKARTLHTPMCAHVPAKLLQSCLTLCDPKDYSLPASSVHGILQARILEWVALPSSRGSSQARGGTQVSCHLYWQAGSLPLAPPGKPIKDSVQAPKLINWLIKNMAPRYILGQPTIGPNTLMIWPWPAQTAPAITMFQSF